MTEQRNEDERRREQDVGGTPEQQTQKPKPTWGEQTPSLDRQRGEGGGGTSSDSDGQEQQD
jgi:hypothetical protein